MNKKTLLILIATLLSLTILMQMIIAEDTASTKEDHSLTKIEELVTKNGEKVDGNANGIIDYAEEAYHVEFARLFTKLGDTEKTVAFKCTDNNIMNGIKDKNRPTCINTQTTSDLKQNAQECVTYQGAAYSGKSGSAYDALENNLNCHILLDPTAELMYFNRQIGNPKIICCK